MPACRHAFIHTLAALLAVVVLSSCSVHTAEQTNPPEEQRAPETTPPDQTRNAPPAIYAFKSAEGIDLVNKARFNSSELEAFLARNREADYVFMIDDRKLFLVYLGSNNLYQFIVGSDTPYKKYHPIPPTIAGYLASSATPSNTSKNKDEPADSISTAAVQLPIETTLSNKNPEPYLDNNVFANIPYAISGLGGHTPIYPKFFYLDKTLRDMTENDYSFKYDPKKNRLRLILPQAYEGGTVYSAQSADTRKIYLYRNADKTSEQALVVPDYFPGSRNYQSTRGKTIKAFGSLYDIDLGGTRVDPGSLRIRYELRLCQQDDLHYCANKAGKNTYIRAIVISAVIYDPASLSVIDAYTLK